jgi:putative transposase
MRPIFIRYTFPYKNPQTVLFSFQTNYNQYHQVDTSLSSRRIIRTLERIIEHRGIPQAVRTDNGPEFTSHHFEGWCRDRKIEIQFIQPGKPMQNGYIDRFNRLYREAVLDAYLFFELYQVRQLTDEWMEEYNYRRPHEGLENLTPKEWKTRLLENENTLKVTV